MKDEILICDCSSVEHQMVLRFDDDKDLGRQVFVEMHLVPLVWYKRLWLGIKYIFGYKCCYGNFEEVILSPKHARQIYGLYRFLRPSVSPEEFKKIVNKDKRSDDVYAEGRRLAAINTASVCENMTKIQKELQKKGGQDE